MDRKRSERKGVTSKNLAKGFCRAKFWAKFPFWRGAVRGEVFREVGREVFHEVFGVVLLGHSEQKKTPAKTSAPNSHDLAQQNWRNFRGKLHDEVLQGDPRQPKTSKFKVSNIPLELCGLHLTILFFEKKLA